jgi:DNA-directed RNA polymerase specialized sigma24 family protein
VRNVIATLVRSMERDLIRAGPASRKNSVVTFVADIDQLPAEYLVQPEIMVPTADADTLEFALAEAVRGREGDPVIQSLLLGLGAKHIVTALGIKAPAARKRLERARTRLRTILKIEAPLRVVRTRSAKPPRRGL